MKMKFFLLIIYILATACAGNSAVVIEEPGIIDSALTTIEVTLTPTNTQAANSNEGQSESPTAQSISTPVSTQPAIEDEATDEAYPPPTTTVESLPAYPSSPERGPKTQNEPYPSQENVQASLPVYGYKIVNEFNHDPQAFTQGLVVTNNGDEFIEGTGLWGQSSLRRVDIKTGEVSQFQELPDEVFGEGLMEFNDQIYQLTWKSKKGFIYDSTSFEQVGEFEYPHEGWGITHNGQEFMVSDGTPTIYFWDPVTLKQTRTIQVADPNGPVARLNELEYYKGEILANVWQTDRIARISPDDGQVLGWIDLTGLYDAGVGGDPDDVLNGIAYDAQADRLYVTGKRWPLVFEIELVEMN